MRSVSWGDLLSLRSISGSLLTSPGHESLMAVHAEDALRCPSISEVLNLLLTVPALEASGAERLVSCENRQILDFVSTVATAVCAVVADEGAVA